MKRFFLVLVMAALCLSGYAQVRQGQSSFGARIGYGFDRENATLGVDYRYSITDEFRLGPSLTYYVKNNRLSAWTIDMDAHYVFPLSDMFGFYPLGGLALSFWSWDGGNFSVNETRLGANLGLGGEVYATEQISVGLEVKYQILKDFSQPMFAVRVGYNF
jgi:opacity protein-like surface antigen